MPVESAVYHGCSTDGISYMVGSLAAMLLSLMIAPIGQWCWLHRIVVKQRFVPMGLSHIEGHSRMAKEHGRTLTIMPDRDRPGLIKWTVGRVGAIFASPCFSVGEVTSSAEPLWRGSPAIQWVQRAVR